MRKIKIILFCLIGVATTQAQVAINNSGLVADPSSILDITATDRGMLIPRIALDSLHDVSTIPSPATSLLIYNTDSVNDVSPGFYYYNGSSWDKFVGADAQNAYNMVFGGNISSSGKSLTYNGSAASGGANNGAAETIGFVPKQGDVKKLSWFSTSADATTDISIVVNGTDNLVSLSGSSGIVTTEITLLEEDKVEIKHVSGTQAPGKISMSLFIE